MMLTEEWPASPEEEYTTWQASKVCPNAATCLEVREWLSPEGVGMVILRDSTDPEGPTLEMSVAEWQVFTAGVKAGQFDL